MWEFDMHVTDERFTSMKNEMGRGKEIFGCPTSSFHEFASQWTEEKFFDVPINLLHQPFCFVHIHDNAVVGKRRIL